MENEILTAEVAEEIKEEPVPDIPEESTEECGEINIAEDIKALATEFPRLGGTDAESLFDKDRYKELRALGLSEREAFLATAKKAAEHNDHLSHLNGSVPRRARALDTGMSVGEMKSAREIFTGLSDEEIRALYRRVTK